MTINRFLKVTAGGRHAWFEAEDDGVRFNIKKPLGVIPLDHPAYQQIKTSLESIGIEAIPSKHLPMMTRWQRFAAWFKSLFR
jgi:hypothetical protein